MSDGTIYFDYEANQIAKMGIEHSEKACKLEMDNEEMIDTIFIKMI